ncbi:hypothetical protein MHM88_22555 [Epibacterium sp. MM17-32]|uniref:ATP-binding protein n=1 Tax=Epibacterium sp. MM17-32 TaxID=2917734 RepID=UPI001EF4E906|nr:ATP-binding protein [Epibacterium sp. MM17-32]MCG7630592.1 hypothetical protein [Epibacterium sp. MM17-32]
MDKQTALEGLETDEPKVRTQAVRYLGTLGDRTTLPALHTALKKERVAFLRRLIRASIDRIETGAKREGAEASEASKTTDFSDGEYQKAVRVVTGIVLHEISSKIGLLKYSAQREVSNYETSQSKSNLDRLSAVIDGIEALRDVSASNDAQPFAPRIFLREAISEVSACENVSIHLNGQNDIEMFGDTKLLSIVLQNGLKNACEATKLANSDEPIVIFWGQSDIENYISILDHGVGIVGPSEAAFEIGKTNKKGHTGFGLAIARMAMTTILGTVDLYPAKLGGMRFEMRWPRDG